MTIHCEQLGNRKWIWYCQTTQAGFWRSPTTYDTQTAARRAAQTWLTRRANPRNRGQ
jgi:hypothetical protein